jgi:hypothetical protein
MLLGLSRSGGSCPTLSPMGSNKNERLLEEALPNRSLHGCSLREDREGRNAWGAVCRD